MEYRELFNHLKWECNFHEGPDGKVNWTCDCELSFAKAFCSEHNLDFALIEAHLNDTGGFCDCGVLFNSIYLIDGDEELPELNGQG
jgi:hypothetical protein